MDVQELVRAIAKEVLKQIRKEADKACVMVLGTRDQALAAKVRECLGEETDVLFLGEEAEKRASVRYILPLLSCSAMADLACGKAIGPFLTEALRLLLTGTEVHVLDFEYKTYRETAPASLYGLYESYEKALASYGMKQFRRELPATVRHWENLVTEQTVIEAREAGATVLWVPVTAKVTPLAADAARSMNINIVYRS
ncbi:MAG: hypothetical protein HY795_15120 [Desulfovibrio sp.]|nr:hypothetical protein [Desulfovibrio sp.]MBI4960623.1 hypothetical protein [Desulfovibrio sp.]